MRAAVYIAAFALAAPAARAGDARDLGKTIDSRITTALAKGKLAPEQIRQGKQQLQNIVRMLFGLIKRNSDRAYDHEDGNGQPAAVSRSSSSS